MKNEKTIADEAGQIVEDAQNLVSATADIGEAKVVSARHRLESALASGRDVLAAVREKAVAGAKATDETIREYPYYAIGVAVGVGALIGFLLGRRR
jgi:ElaB/YqjD/DUF883 family membrane-anchored ribosome-binding protein